MGEKRHPDADIDERDDGRCFHRPHIPTAIVCAGEPTRFRRTATGVSQGPRQLAAARQGNHREVWLERCARAIHRAAEWTMLIGVPKEVKTHEYRVGLVP